MYTKEMFKRHFCYKSRPDTPWVVGVKRGADINKILVGWGIDKFPHSFKFKKVDRLGE